MEGWLYAGIVEAKLKDTWEIALKSYKNNTVKIIY